ncbi:hypothetical protein IU459_34995 [Nocardia amamiensis]|uniref:DUF4190 domain-containing protein n=1 Tax=Nocardia amamiensis TaxID=404578 RepID=A0ABS0D3Z4_9NOCA|nr:hypothetical protein [Nocardia amamiensis]MBF6302702.1 hypothetical protein [Nocardia amamiensis]
MSILLVYPVVAVLIAVVVIAVVARPNPASARGRKRTGRVARGVVGGALGAAAGMTVAGLLGAKRR